MAISLQNFEGTELALGGVRPSHFTAAFFRSGKTDTAISAMANS